MFHRFRFDEQGRLSKDGFLEFYGLLNCNYPRLANFKEFVACQWGFPLACEGQMGSVQEVLRVILKQLKALAPGQDEPALRQAFDRLDLHREGRLSFEVVKDMLRQMGIVTDERIAAAAFARLDVNKSGAVEFKEFRDFVRFEPS
jgi:hypothetical protein